MKDSKKYYIKQAAVLGAGVMGAQIAAHLINAGIPTILFDLPSEKGEQNAIVEQSINALKKLKPAPLGVENIEKGIIAANYNADLVKLLNCDLIIEAIAERLDWKENLYNKIAPYIHEQAILASNTSGLSISKLAEVLPAKLRSRFCGVHFFNPPRYMKLVELIPHASTEQIVLNSLETFLVTTLGKGVIYAKDTPNFIGNRIGVFALLCALYHSNEFGLAPDTVDALTGPLIGRPKSATFRTMDIVGLDTLQHVVNTMRKELPTDPWKNFFTLPNWILQLIERGALGQKNQTGIYKKVKNEIHVYDYHDDCYRLANAQVDVEVKAILSQQDAKARLLQLSQSHHPQARFVWRIFCDLFHYCAYHFTSIADTAREIDLAMRWGYGWQEGPFESWQKSDWQFVAGLITHAIQNKRTLTEASLPAWVTNTSFMGPYQQGKAFSAIEQCYKSRSILPIYEKQYFKEPMLTDLKEKGETIFETPAVRLWSLGDELPILSFKTKKNSITTEVLEGIQEAISRAEADYDALILWQANGNDFSVGANLHQILEGINGQHWGRADETIKLFQQTALAMRKATIPTIVAVQGLTLGGGCELAMHASRRVATFESYIGLVEVGVGILPAGGGTKELALRAAMQAKNGEILDFIKPYFEQIAYGVVSSSALDARRLNYLRPSDEIVFNQYELLYAAKKHARFLAESYRPPLALPFAVAGIPAIANLTALLINLREGEFITDHEFLIGTKIARVLCGGEVEAGTLVDEQWVLDLEREAVAELIQTKATIERMKYMLEKGKPLRN